MGEKRLINYNEYRKSDLINRDNAGVIPSGVYAGFDYDSSSSGTTLILQHNTSGFRDVEFVDGSPTLFTAMGLIVTPQGVKIRYLDSISLEVTPNTSTNPRIDTIVCQHVNTPIPGGADSGFIIMVGTPSTDPTPPTPVFITDTIVGYLHVPGSASVVTDMTWVRAHVPSFGNDSTVLHSDVASEVTANYRFDQLAGVAGELSIVSLGGGEYKLHSTTAHNYYYVSPIDLTPRLITQLDIPEVQGMSSVRIYTHQPLRFQIGGNIGLNDSATVQLLRSGGFIEFINLKGSLGYGSAFYRLVSGNIPDNGPAKMFNTFSEYKGSFEIDSNGCALLGYGNFIQASFDFDAVRALTGGIRSVWSHDYLADGVNDATKAGTRIFLKVDDTGSLGELVLFHQYGGGILGGSKRLTFADGQNHTVRTGAVIVLLEDETDYKVLEIADSQSANYVLYNALIGSNTIMTNAEHKFTKLQSNGIVNLGTVDISSGQLNLPDTGNTFIVAVAPNGTLDNIKLVRGTGSPVTYPTGAQITLIMSHTTFDTGSDVCSRFNLTSGYINSVINDGITAFPNTSTSDYVSIISKVLGDNLYTVFQLVKTSTVWQIINVDYTYGIAARQIIDEANITAITANTTFTDWTDVTVFGTHWAAGTPNLRYRAVGTSNKMVYIDGNFTRTSGVGGTVIFTLPVGMHPVRKIIAPITYIDAGTYYPAWVHIETDGTVNYAGDIATSHDYWMNVSFGI